MSDAATQGLDSVPTCPHAGACGGCTYQGVPYDEQLRIKNDLVLAHLAENEIVPGEYRPVRQTGRQFAYRNKMEYTFGDEVKGGEMTLGLHKQGSYMSVISTDGCLIVPDIFNRIRSAILEWAHGSGHSFYHKRSRSGFLRALVIRRGERTGEVLANLVTTSEEALDDAAFCETVFAATNNNDGDSIVGILHTINDRRSDVVACDSMKTLYGRDHFYDKLLGLTFRIGAFSFFQTNTSAVESMLDEALALIPDKRAETLYDVYCGTGTISLALSGRAGQVTGIELNEDSVISARENAGRNDVKNAAFVCGDAFEVMRELPPPDLLVVDPPRMGLHPKALKRVIEYGLPALLYISCNPKTFAQNAAMLKSAGYGITTLGAYDNFPFTKHIELSALIERL
ncbi:MAG: 23S rRNA (uracil(1939)-C(5))-methyltransferase RlmD [Clostridiales bacterium]|nr:23S rRNA (uracil(1939)-C(5))-methyltransferase RlmD [Clostridiales bacterium]